MLRKHHARLLCLLRCCCGAPGIKATWTPPPFWIPTCAVGAPWLSRLRCGLQTPTACDASVWARYLLWPRPYNATDSSWPCYTSLIRPHDGQGRRQFAAIRLKVLPCFLFVAPLCTPSTRPIGAVSADGFSFLGPHGFPPIFTGIFSLFGGIGFLES